jgi:hypothetical protein
MTALLSLKQPNRFLLPGVMQKTSARDHFIVSQMQLIRFQNGVWQKAGPLLEARPR